MNKKILFLFFIFLNYFAQLPYSWTTGVNPGWTSANFGSGGALNWNGSCLGGVVTTNCTGNYANNQNTSYTSPVINATCTNASSVLISFYISGNAEYGYDFLFCEYSLNGGATWINFYGPSVGLTGNAGPHPGTLWTLPPVPTSSNFRFRFTFTSDFIFTYSGYKLTNFLMVCNTPLSVDLLDFSVDKFDGYNIIKFITDSYANLFVVERSFDGINWHVLTKIQKNINLNNQLNYNFKDYSFIKGLNYYRLKIIKLNNEIRYSNIIIVDNSDSNLHKPIKIINIYGQEVDEDYNGIKIYFYQDGTYKKILK